MNTNTVNKISAQEAEELLKSSGSNCILLDVRTPAEYSGLHATKATNMPLQNISGESIQSLKGKKIICICQKGTRGENAANILCKNGFTEVYNIEGGTEAWESAGLPVEKGKSSISLERQVRIAAGSLVALGVIAGYLITPYAFLLALFVGCGLVFSGVTNTCGMALLLARCPWNLR